MTGPSLRGDSPRGQASAESSGAVTGVLAIVALLAMGLVLRLIIVFLLPNSGFPNDLGAFRYWGNDIAQNGPLGFYVRQSFIDYPPVYLLMLSLASLLTGGNNGDAIKLLPMLSDLGLAAIVWRMAQDLGVSNRRAMAAAVIVLINPVTWFNSAIWGQADSVGSIFLLLGIWALQKDRRELASVLSVLAVLTKMQLGILGFIVGLVVVRRSLAPKEGPRDPERILSSLGAGLATAALVCLPFTGIDVLGAFHRLASGPGLITIAFGLVAGAGVLSLGRRYLPIADVARRTQASAVLGVGTVVGFAGMVFEPIVTHLINTFGEYPYLTLNAYNPWALMADGTSAMDRSLSWLHDAPWTDPGSLNSGTGYLIGPFPTTVVVIVLSLAALLVVAGVAGRLLSRVLERSAEVAAADAEAGGSVVVRTLWAALAEAAGFWGAFLVAGATVAVVVVAAMSGQLYAAFLGDGLLLATLLGVGAWAAWRDDKQSLLVALAILTIAFFVLPTRAHERYLFPFFAVGAVLMVSSWRWSVTYLVLTVANIANLLAVLVQYNGIPSSDGSLAGTLINWGTDVTTTTWKSTDWSNGMIWPIAACGLATGLAMVWALLQLRPRAVASLERELATASRAHGASEWWSRLSPDEPLEAPGVAGAPLAAGSGPVAVAAASATSAYEFDETDEDDDWVDEDGYLYGPDRPTFVPRWATNLWQRVSRQSSYPDRSAALDSEPRGRLDKLDLWVIAALVIAVLSMRIYRLDEPLQMHFDEVYHARTATEFLQEWQYGTPHNIYEWTHPHLAKYAIAGGITLFSDDKVTSTGQLDVTVKDALVQARTDSSPIDQSPSPDATANLDNTYGDRAFVATGSSVLVYSLENRALVHTYQIAGAQAFSQVDSGGLVYVGTSSGRIFVIDTNSLDDVQNGVSQTVKAAKDLGVDTHLAITHVYAGTSGFVLAAADNGDIVSVQLSSDGDTIAARGNVPGASDFADMGTGPAVLLKNPTGSTSPTPTPTDSSSPPGAEAQALATALGLDAGDVQSAIDALPSSDVPQALDLGDLTPDQVTSVQKLVSDGTLTDIRVDSTSLQVMVAYAKGIGILDLSTLSVSLSVPTDSPATSIALNYSNLSGSDIRTDQPSYVAAGKSIVLVDVNETTTPWTVAQHGTSMPMPGPVTKVLFDRATRIAHALGLTPDGKGWTVYAIESNGNAVFSDAQLPFGPVAVGLDVSPMLSDNNHEDLLAFSPTGSMVTVDVGQFAFSWRIIGVLFGALMAVCLYLLVRLMFRRRSIGLLVALFSLTDGMLFVQSRIAMNDTYVGGFLLLAYLIFAIMWFQVGKSRKISWLAFWLGMPIMGVVLGLALASKWVALYAIASIGVLILIRSALGRLLTILGLAGATGVLGWMAIAEMTTVPNTGNPAYVVLLVLGGILVFGGGLWWAATMRATPDKIFVGVASTLIAAGMFGAALTLSPGAIQNGAPNYTYFLIMIVATAIAAAANAYHPIAWTREEYWFAIGAPMVLGVLALIDGVLRHNGLALEAGAAGLVAGPLIAGAFWFAGTLGFGPQALPPGPNDPASYAGPPAPAPTGWLRLGSGFGLPAVWMALCVVVLPIAVYVAFYIPWAMPWQPQTAATTASYAGGLPVLYCPDADANGYCVNGDGWPNGHTGKDLIQQTIDMYNYHNDLRSPHPASSPWWAWPLDLKPVWFENATYAGDNGTMIYDGGNPALWWLAISAMAFICWQAFKRRSLGLTLVAMAFFWQWLSWARIDRAAFEYHFYTAVPFFLVALAYFLAELWHGPSRRTWLFARFAAAGALLFPAIAWLLKYPLCGLARVGTSDFFGNTACGTATGDVRVETRMLLIVIVLIVALASLAVLLWRLERRQRAGKEDPFWIGQLLVPVGIASVLLWWLGENGSRDIIWQAAVPPDLITILMLVLGLVLAFVVMTAHNPRRYVLGACAFAVVTFVALYPNLSALPLPNAIINVYESILPTWFYGFQFSVNQQPAAHISPIQTASITLALLALLVSGIAGWAAWERRVVIGYRRARLFWTGHPADAGDQPDAADQPSDESADAPSGDASRKDKPES